jgi:hypothetical protein
MHKRKIANLTTMSGAALFLVALLWWAATYSQVTNELHNAIPCLYATDGGCGVVNTVAKIGGQTPYEPFVFWIALVTLAIGLMMRLDVARTSSRR